MLFAWFGKVFERLRIKLKDDGLAKILLMESNISQLERAAEEYRACPVIVPEGALSDLYFCAAVRRLANGEMSSFIAVLRSRRLRTQLQTVRVKGELPTGINDWEKVRNYLEVWASSHRVAVDWNRFALAEGMNPVHRSGVLSVYSMRKQIRQIRDGRMLIEQ